MPQSSWTGAPEDPNERNTNDVLRVYQPSVTVGAGAVARATARTEDVMSRDRALWGGAIALALGIAALIAAMMAVAGDDDTLCPPCQALNVTTPPPQVVCAPAAADHAGGPNPRT